MLGNEPVHALDGACSAGNDGELGVKTLEIKLADDAVMALLNEEHARAGLELLLDELELPFSQSETTDVVIGIGIHVREEDLGRGLLDNGPADRAAQHVTGALGRKTHHTVELTPGLGSILGEALERRIGQETPEFIHPAHQPPAVQQLSDQMKEVQRYR